MNTPKNRIVILKGERQITKIDDESLPLYFRDINSRHYKLLSKEEEIELSKKIQNGDRKAVDNLVCSNLRFVISIAKMYQNHGVGLSDLVNEGNIGLIKAAETYDYTRETRFATYAVWHIRQSILLALTQQSKIVHIPLNKYNNQFKIKKLIEDFISRNGNDVHLTKEQIAKELNLEMSQVEDALDTPSGMGISINTRISDDNDKSTLEDVIQNKNADSPDANLDKDSLSYEINRMLKVVLTEEEIRVIKLFYGIGYENAHSLQEIADRTIDKYTGKPVTKECIRQWKERALRRLKLSEHSALNAFK